MREQAKFHEVANDRLGRLPPELYFMVLEALNSHDDTAMNSLAILNLARSARLHLDLITFWTGRAAQKDISLIKDLQVDLGSFIPMGLHSNICIFSKRLAGICAICNNRAQMPDGPGEFFTDLQLCHACDPVYFPKISLGRLMDNFNIVGDPLRTVRYRVWLLDNESGELSSREGPFYRWKDIQSLELQGLVQRLPHVIFGYEIELHNGEEYGSYSPPNLVCESDEDLEPRAGDRWDWTVTLFNSFINSNMDWSKCSSLGPTVIEVALFREFRFRFDPTWRPMTSFARDLNEYGRCASQWATKSLWDGRPWRLQNFPQQPRSAFIYPQFENLTDRINDPSFKMYQFLCAKTRAVLKAFPDILRSPLIWLNCMGDQSPGVSISEAIEMALQAKRAWKEPKSKDVDIEIRRAVGKCDIEFVRKGKCLKPGTSHSGIGRSPGDGEVFKVDILKFSGESIVTSSQTRVGDVNHRLKPFLDD